jgi:hypothetical protein
MRNLGKIAAKRALWLRLGQPFLAFVVLEKLHLPEALLGFRLVLVWPAEVFPLLGQHFVAALRFFDHGFLLKSILTGFSVEAMDGLL